MAAVELNVTPSAVSHGIVGLEEVLGTELFVRKPRGLSMTPAGVLAALLRFPIEDSSPLAALAARL